MTGNSGDAMYLTGRVSQRARAIVGGQFAELSLSVLKSADDDQRHDAVHPGLESIRQSLRARWSRPDQTERITTIAVIGEFTTNGNTILGNVRTLTVSMKTRLNPIERTSRDAPDFRIMSGAAEVGAAWSQISGDGEPYISVKLDAPSFPPRSTRHFGRPRRKATTRWSGTARSATPDRRRSPAGNGGAFPLLKSRRNRASSPLPSSGRDTESWGLLRVTNRAVSK
ncbi:DUF736 family protein [Rhizobium rhizogenes]|uniref:DUF736 family protein n=1 Tax=Rhizobium rhizogenes TaxID=359 RepID=UPI001F2A86CE